MHIVLNNHVGFTTLPIESRTSEHCTDTARATGVPVIHANAGVRWLALSVCNIHFRLAFAGSIAVSKMWHVVCWTMLQGRDSLVYSLDRCSVCRRPRGSGAGAGGGGCVARALAEGHHRRRLRLPVRCC